MKWLLHLLQNEFTSQPSPTAWRDFLSLISVLFEAKGRLAEVRASSTAFSATAKDLPHLVTSRHL